LAVNSRVAQRKTMSNGPSKSEIRLRVNAAAWGSFFIWVGSSIFANIRWGWFLVGIGAIVLVAQVALRIAGEKLDGPWLICGAVFLAAGIWEILGLKWPLAPLLIIFLGVGVLWQAFFSRPESKP
jgi:hypothetical protein